MPAPKAEQLEVDASLAFACKMGKLRFAAGEFASEPMLLPSCRSLSPLSRQCWRSCRVTPVCCCPSKRSPI
jgi:hypothetical protein